MNSLIRKYLLTGISKQQTLNYCIKAQGIEKTLNNITLLGRIGADPQKKGSTDHPCVTFSIATHTNYRYESGEWAQRTDWHKVVVFKPNLRDNIMDYMKKGQRALVQGKITYGEIVDQEGKQKATASVIADDVVFFREKT